MNQEHELDFPSGPPLSRLARARRSAGDDAGRGDGRRDDRLARGAGRHESP